MAVVCHVGVGRATLFTRIGDTITVTEVSTPLRPRFRFEPKSTFVSKSGDGNIQLRIGWIARAFHCCRSDCPGLSHTFGSNCPTKSVKISGDRGMRETNELYAWLNYMIPLGSWSFFDF